MVGKFLSKFAATSIALKGLVNKAIINLGNVSFKTDAVTSDGASWNQKVWSDAGTSIGTVSYSENPFKFPDGHPFFEPEPKPFFFICLI